MAKSSYRAQMAKRKTILIVDDDVAYMQVITRDELREKLKVYFARQKAKV